MCCEILKQKLSENMSTATDSLILKVDLRKCMSIPTVKDIKCHFMQVTFSSCTVLWDQNLKLPLKVKIPLATPVIIEICDGQSEKSTQLPKNIAENIISILTMKTNFRAMDSHIFATSIMARPGQNLKEIAFKGSGSCSKSDADMVVFTPACVLKNRDHVHSVVYLDHGIYIDKMGATTVMSVRTRSQILSQYPDAEIVDQIIVVECDQCKKPESPSCVMKWCKNCHTVMYCSQECQKIAWSYHKSICKIMRSLHGNAQKNIVNSELMQSLHDIPMQQGMKSFSISK